MRNLWRKKCGILMLLVFCFFAPVLASARTMQTQEGEEFGPVVRAYLGYLKNEQEVVDDRASRHEVSPAYYRRNSNRIRALRQVAIRIARETRNDYIPELEAVTRDELRLLFERPPLPQSLKPGDVVKGTFRFMGAVRTSEVFYVFARLDPYEQAEIREQSGREQAAAGSGGTVPVGSTTRERRVTVP